MPTKPTLIKSEIVAESRLFEIEQMHLQFSNGEQRHYERIKGRANGAVMIVPVLDDQTILLIREYAGGIDDYVLAFPKGAIDPGEDVVKTADRELKEEVGYGANNIEIIGNYSVSPGYMTAMMHVVIARDLYPERHEGDEPEPIEVVPWKLSDIEQLLMNPQFHEARSIAALLMLERTLRR